MTVYFPLLVQPQPYFFSDKYSLTTKKKKMKKAKLTSKLCSVTYTLKKRHFQYNKRGHIQLLANCVWLSWRKHVCMYGYTYSSKSRDQPGKAANPVRGQLNSENDVFPVHVRA